MPWFGLVVRDRGVQHTVADVGPLPDRMGCVGRLMDAMAAEGFRVAVAAQHELGHGCLLEGRRGEELIVALAWAAEWISQGALELQFQRLGVLRQPWRPPPPPGLLID